MKPRVLIDTNLLMLLVVGLYQKDYISRHKRTDKFTEDDFDVLSVLLDDHELIVTPNILTEVSNLLWSGPAAHKIPIREVLKGVITLSREYSQNSSEVASCSEFMKLGLTDAGILELNELSGIILTADLDLHLAALERGLKSENFTHYRKLL